MLLTPPSILSSSTYPSTHPWTHTPTTLCLPTHPSSCSYFHHPPTILHPPTHLSPSANQVLPHELPTSAPHGPGTGPCTSVEGEGAEAMAETQRLVLACHGLGGVWGQTGVARAHASEVSLCAVPVGTCTAEIQTQG